MFAAVQADNVLHVVRVGEHIHRLHSRHLVLRIEQGQVAGLCGGVATDIDDAFGGGKEEGLNDVVVHAGDFIDP